MICSGYDAIFEHEHRIPKACYARKIQCIKAFHTFGHFLSLCTLCYRVMW